MSLLGRLLNRCLATGSAPRNWQRNANEDARRLAGRRALPRLYVKQLFRPVSVGRSRAGIIRNAVQSGFLHL